MNGVRSWLAEQLNRDAAGRMRRRYPDWADAMVSENAALAGHDDQLNWAFGAWWASLTLGEVMEVLYPALLLAAVAAMVLYQWSADESLITLSIITGLGLVLGFLRPERFLVSGVAVGLVVAGVNIFETVSGIRPAYEVFAHSLVHDLRWLLLIAPALVGAVIGRQVGRFLSALTLAF